MDGYSIASHFDRTGQARIADRRVVTAAASLPWPTSTTGIPAVLWLLALMATLGWVDPRREPVMSDAAAA
jgi:hypothetical protein